MKRFLTQIILICILPVLLLLGVFEYSLRTVPNDYAYKDTYIHNHGDKIRILNLGSSHTYAGIQPKYFSKKAFNLAFSSQNLKYDHFLYTHYIPLLDSLEYLIIPMSYFSTRLNMDNHAESWRIKNYCIYMGCNYHPFDIDYHLEITSKDKMKHLTDALLGKANFINCDSLGRGNKYSLSKRNKSWKSKVNDVLEVHNKDKNDVDIQENLLYLYSIIADAKRRHIKVILLTTPTSDIYRNNLNEEQLQEVYDVCYSLDKHFEHVRYLNWLQHEDFTEDDFYDLDHLNEFGAEKLTRLLDRFILEWD